MFRFQPACNDKSSGNVTLGASVTLTLSSCLAIFPNWLVAVRRIIVSPTQSPITFSSNRRSAKILAISSFGSGVMTNHLICSGGVNVSVIYRSNSISDQDWLAFSLIVCGNSLIVGGVTFTDSTTIATSSV